MVSCERKYAKNINRFEFIRSLNYVLACSTSTHVYIIILCSTVCIYHHFHHHMRFPFDITFFEIKPRMINRCLVFVHIVSIVMSSKYITFKNSWKHSLINELKNVLVIIFFRYNLWECSYNFLSFNISMIMI